MIPENTSHGEFIYLGDPCGDLTGLPCADCSHNFFTLDCGSGGRPRGTVNIDIIKKFQKADFTKAPNFILASGEHLPFRSNVFRFVLSFHTLEHVHNPQKMLLELIRVCEVGGRAHVQVPHRFGKYARCTPEHLCMFNVSWFKKFADKYSLTCGIITSWGFSLPMPLFLPSVIDVQFYKTVIQK